MNKFLPKPKPFSYHIIQLYRSIRLCFIAFLFVFLFSPGLSSAQTSTYNYTGVVQTYTVPACTYSLTIDARGAEGAASTGAYVSLGGRGGQVQATISVTPGEILEIHVGQKPVANAAGWNGGGSAANIAGGGGGASDIRQGGSALTNRTIVAAGGGGAGYYTNTSYIGGHGGGLNGTNGYNGTLAGGGGTQTGGGSGGVYNNVNGSPGTLGIGGNGSASDGGAGGGGYYGGGGGTGSAARMGGGGGSSFAVASATSITHTTGTQLGHGQVLITPITGTPAPGTITGAVSVCSGGTFTYSISPVFTATSYVWSAPPGSAIITGQGTNTVEVTFGTDTGDISVSAVGPCGTSTPTLLSVIINPAPVVVATATPPQYCWGGSSQLNAAGGVTGLVTVGTGTVTNTTSGYPAPYGQYYTGARHQMLIRASELNAAGFYAGNINSLAFYVATPNGTYSDFTISLATTALSALTTTFVTGATQVFITPNFIPVPGWNTHNFQTPFYWNGTSNLIVETYFMNCATCPTTACSSVSSNAIHHSTNTSYVSSNYYRANLNCNVATQTTGTTISRRPNMRFGIGPLEYSWSPATALSNDTIANPVASPTATTTYTATIIDGYGCSGMDSVTVTVDAPPAAPIATTNSPVCAGSTLNLFADPVAGGSFQWSGPNGFTASLQNISIPNASTSLNGTYSVTVTVNGCTSPPATITVVVNPSPAATVASSNSPVCEGSPLNLFASTVTGAGYNWSGPNGFTSSNQNPVISSPTAAASGTYTVFASENGCNSAQSTVTVQVNANPVVSFTGLNNSYCLSNPTVTLAGNPAGGTFTGPGINGNTFSPSSAGIGTHTIQYNFSDANGCSGSASQVVIISNSASANLGPDALICINGQIVLSPGNFVSYTWQDNSTTPTYLVSGAALGVGAFTFYVDVVDANGCQGVDSVVVTVDFCTGMTEAMTGDISVLPNPTGAQVTICLPSLMEKPIFVLTDIRGQTIKREFVKNSSNETYFELDLSDLSKGIYFLQVSDGEQIWVKKIVLQ